GAESIDAVRTLHLLAGAYEQGGQHEEAAELYERSLSLRERVLGSNPEDLADMQFNLAGRYVDWGKYARARELLNKAIGTFKLKNSFRLALAHEALAHVEEHAGRYAYALDELTQAGRVWELLGKDRIAELRWNLEHRAELFEILRNRQEALGLRQRVA